MLQKPNTVFVGKKLNTAGTSVVAGDIVLINAETGAVIATTDLTTDASAPKAIQFGYAKSATDIVKTQIIGRQNTTNISYSDDVAKTEASVVLDWTGVTVSAGKRYVIRIIYRDIYEHPGQFTHTYEVVAASGETIDTLADKFYTKINAHAGARVVATKDANADTLTLTAKVVDGPEAGIATKEAITPYSQVQMKVVAYYTDPSSLLSRSYNEIVGLTITNTESKPGKGNPFVVRDREQAALGYKGITYRTEWPVIKPELNVDLSKTYDTLIVEFNKVYQSPDNQYVKSTDLAAEIYTEAGTDLKTFATALSAWASLVGPQGEPGV